MLPKDIEFLTVETVEEAHTIVIDGYGGSDGLRDKGILESAVMSVQNGYYSSLVEIAAAYAFKIIMNHPFIDGNKRTGLFIAGAFLENNGISITLDEVEWEEIMLNVADGLIDQDELTEEFEKAVLKTN